MSYSSHERWNLQKATVLNWWIIKLKSTKIENFSLQWIDDPEISVHSSAVHWEIVQVCSHFFLHGSLIHYKCYLRIRFNIKLYACVKFELPLAPRVSSRIFWDYISFYSKWFGLNKNSFLKPVKTEMSSVNFFNWGILKFGQASRLLLFRIPYDLLNSAEWTDWYELKAKLIYF